MSLAAWRTPLRTAQSRRNRPTNGERVLGALSRLPDELLRLEAGEGIAGSLAARLNAIRTGPTISAEILRGAVPYELDDAWSDLVARADVANVFMAPAMLREAALCGARIVIALAWQGDADERRLAGLWGFSLGRPREGILPLQVLRAPASEHAYLATPVIDRNCVEPVLTAMLDAIAAAQDLPTTVSLSAMSGKSATAAALTRLLDERGSTTCCLKSVQRPKLGGGADPNAYLEAALSSSTRKKLRQYRRRLGERGKLELKIARSPHDMRDAGENFLQLEAGGWKGRRGTALLSHPDDATFARGVLAAFAERGEACIYSLALDGRPVSMQIVLRAGPTAFTWKTAYREALGEFSPGMLLFEDYTKAFLADSSIASVDSCAYDDTSFMGGWSEREQVVDFMFDARRGASTPVRVAARINSGYLVVRERVKRLWHRGRAELAPIQRQMRVRLQAWGVLAGARV
jgi:CelD/BcsL family acetyltransferase involved in cellulose biosynthesis